MKKGVLIYGRVERIYTYMDLRRDSGSLMKRIHNRNRSIDGWDDKCGQTHLFRAILGFPDRSVREGYDGTRHIRHRNGRLEIS